MRTYRGLIIGAERRVQYRREDEERWRGLLPRLNIRNHSGSLSWGHSGAGAAQLALALLVMEIGSARAQVLYQHFKATVIAQLDRDKGWVMRSADVLDWIATQS